MTSQNMGRRTFVAGIGALGATISWPGMAQSRPTIQVLKDPDCGCCNAWIAIMQREGFDMRVESASWESLARFKAISGIPEDMASCHTAQIEGYMIEGHVPAGDIRRMLAERPDAIGLSVPGMPYGSPGMGPEDERDTYSVYLIRKDGSTEVYALYEGN